MSKYRSYGEKKLAAIIRREGIPLSYVGKGDFWITLANGKGHVNPDFINQGKHKIVELWGAVHSAEEMETKRQNYAEKGWDCLLIDDKELYQSVESVEQKLKAFMGVPKATTSPAGESS